MRALVTGLLLVASLSFGSASAQRGPTVVTSIGPGYSYTDVLTPWAKRVTAQTPGYRRVELFITIPIPANADREKLVRQSFFTFCIESSSRRIQMDSESIVNAIGYFSRDYVHPETGRFFSGSCTWLRVRAYIEEESDSEFTLKTALILPNEVAVAQPSGHTQLANGDVYTLRWHTVLGVAVMRLER